MARNEIFCVSGNALMVTSVEEANASLRIGKPEQLFSGDDLGEALDPVKISGNFAGRLYDVSPMANGLSSSERCVRRYAR